MAVITLPSVASTNTWAKTHAQTLNHGDIVVTSHQSAGRGQRGNRWEAEPGKNLTFSIFLRPVAISPAEQFVISEIVSLAVAYTLRCHLPPAIAENVAVKWPNDIYVNDRKIGGILIEHTISGTGISHTVVGIGLNVNQTIFLSDAPNPVSMAMLANHQYDLCALMNELGASIVDSINSPKHAETHAAYLTSLWRNDGRMHPFSTPDGTTFQARIADVASNGILRLATPEGIIRDFAFKEVAFSL